MMAGQMEQRDIPPIGEFIELIHDSGGGIYVVLALRVVAAPAPADDIRPDSDARPFADEVCIERCDNESDQCMQDSEGDPRKTQACDDEYSECLRACEAG